MKASLRRIINSYRSRSAKSSIKLGVGFRTLLGKKPGGRLSGGRNADFRCWAGKTRHALAGRSREQGFDVVGVDRIPGHVAAILDRQAPISEPGLQALLSEATGRIEATSDIKGAVSASDVTFVVVPTPSGADGTFSNLHVISAIREIGAALRGKTDYHLVVITSTVMPESTGGPIRQALEGSSGRVVGVDLGLCYNPEFIALGSVIRDMLRPDFVLIGELDGRAGDLLASIYERVCENRPTNSAYELGECRNHKANSKFVCHRENFIRQYDL